MRDNENQQKKSKDNESLFAYSFFDLRTSRDKSLSVDPSPSVSEGQYKLKTNDFTCSFDQNSYTLIVRQMQLKTVCLFGQFEAIFQLYLKHLLV